MIMKRIFALLVGVLLFFTAAHAEKRVVDAESQAPIVGASILDAAGNVVGLTWTNGVFSGVPESAYPITIRSIGYEQLIIVRPEEKTWEMTPLTYELEEVVIVPVKRNVLKQTFYAREYYSLNTETDTITFFGEHMAERFVPTTKDAKFGGKTSLRLLATQHYSRFKILGKDSVLMNPKAAFPSLLNFLEPTDDEVVAHESLKNAGRTSKVYEKSGKSGVMLMQKQNDQTFSTIKDALAEYKDHKISPWPLKMLGYTMDFNQMFKKHTYRVNDKGTYLPKDLMEVSFVIEADGRGKNLRKVLKSEKPVEIHVMIELYVVDRDYLSKEEAKKEYKNKPTDVKFVIPSSVPPLNEATRRLVERAKAQERNINN